MVYFAMLFIIKSYAHCVRYVRIRAKCESRFGPQRNQQVIHTVPCADCVLWAEQIRIMQKNGIKKQRKKVNEKICLGPLQHNTNLQNNPAGELLPALCKFLKHTKIFKKWFCGKKGN